MSRTKKKSVDHQVYNTQTLFDYLFLTTTTQQPDYISFLPSELLFNIFDFLPLSQLYRVGKVSRRCRQVIQQYHIFKDIAVYLDKSKMEHAYFLCLEYSKRICERCGFVSPQDAIGSSTCLPIESDDMVLSLCLPCRRNHYKRHPEPSRPLPERQHLLYVNEQHLRHYSLPIFTAMIEYALSRQDLSALKHVMHEMNLAPSVRHYIESEVVDLARSIHGGDVGIYQEIASSLIRYRVSSYQIKSSSRDRVRRKLVTEKAQLYKIKFIPESAVFTDYVLFGRGNVKAVLEDMQVLDWMYCHDLLDKKKDRVVNTEVIRDWMAGRIRQGNYSPVDECPPCLWETLERERMDLIKEKLKQRLKKTIRYLCDNKMSMILSRERFLLFVNASTADSCLISDAVGIHLEDLEPMMDLSPYMV